MRDPSRRDFLNRAALLTGAALTPIAVGRLASADSALTRIAPASPSPAVSDATAPPARTAAYGAVAMPPLRRAL